MYLILQTGKYDRGSIYQDKEGIYIMSDIIAYFQADLMELQRLLLKYTDGSQEVTKEDRALLDEKSIYLENTYTLEELQAEGLSNAQIIQCLETEGIVLGYCDLVRKNIPEALDHFMMALHYDPYSEDALSSLLELFMENMEEEGKGRKVYELLSQMYDFDKETDKEMVMECALEVGFVQLCNEIVIRETEK